MSLDMLQRTFSSNLASVTRDARRIASKETRMEEESFIEGMSSEEILISGKYSLLNPSLNASL